MKLLINIHLTNTWATWKKIMSQCAVYRDITHEVLLYLLLDATDHLLIYFYERSVATWQIYSL